MARVMVSEPHRTRENRQLIVIYKEMSNIIERSSTQFVYCYEEMSQ